MFLLCHFAPDILIFLVTYMQVETVAQFGVVFLLFALGLEFSLAKVCYSCLAKTYCLTFIYFLAISSILAKSQVIV